MRENILVLDMVSLETDDRNGHIIYIKLIKIKKEFFSLLDVVSSDDTLNKYMVWQVAYKLLGLIYYSILWKFRNKPMMLAF